MYYVRQFLASAKVTWIEVVEQPVSALLLLFSVLLTLANPLFEFQRFGEEGRLARDSGLACLFLFGLVFAILAAGSRFGSDFRRGTADVTLVKPISPAVFFCSKVCGVLGAVLSFAVPQALAVLMAEKIAPRYVITPAFQNYLYEPVIFRMGLLAVLAALGGAALSHACRVGRFGVRFFVLLPITLSVAAFFSGAHQRLGGWVFSTIDLDWRIFAAAALIILLLMLYAVLAAVFAARLPGTVASILCCGILVLGVGADLIVPALPSWGRFAFDALVPNVQNFWLADQLADGGRIALGYVSQAAAFSGVRAVLWAVCGVYLLKQREGVC